MPTVLSQEEKQPFSQRNFRTGTGLVKPKKPATHVDYLTSRASLSQSTTLDGLQGSRRTSQSRSSLHKSAEPAITPITIADCGWQNPRLALGGPAVASS
eukprot:2996018-Amphidinium_carterae.1